MWRQSSDALWRARVAAMRLLFIGDVVGGPGRRGLRETMPSLRERYEPDLIVVNG